MTKGRIMFKLRILLLVVAVCLLVSAPATVSAVTSSWSNGKLTREVKQLQRANRDQAQQLRFLQEFSRCFRSDQPLMLVNGVDHEGQPTAGIVAAIDADLCDGGDSDWSQFRFWRGAR